MTTQVIPVVTMQELLPGYMLTGGVPDGIDSEELNFRGRYRKFTRCSVAGEFPSPDLIGMRVQDVYWNLPSTTPTVSIYLVDDDGNEYLVNAEAAVSGHYVETNKGFFVPPGYKVRVKSTAAITESSAAAEDTGVTGDGRAGPYAIQLANPIITPTTVSIVCNTVTFTDAAGDGVLTGAGAGGGTGTVDYTTGLVSVTLSTPGDWAAGNAIAAYDHGTAGRVVLTQVYGWGQPAQSEVGTIGRSKRPPAMERS